MFHCAKIVRVYGKISQKKMWLGTQWVENEENVQATYYELRVHLYVTNATVGEVLFQMT